ncbi:hypothetical protein V8G54_025031 [Vigna mungo]|uniref:non-specific serine/threonine protein kinase n=1 Tax=Vigna mungo TaxID=3915 RepID=A0AAQ3N894_VIGMU
MYIISGLNSENVSADAKDLSSPSSKIIKELSNTVSKVSEVSMPHTLQSEGEIWHPSNLKSFSLTELTAATRNFRKDSVLGEGGLGSVFKGWIDDHSLSATKPGTGIVVAVKRLSQDTFQGHEEWLARHGITQEESLKDEVNCLGQLSHPHLVKLIGYCFEDRDRLLVYEFMPRGSLENHLFMRGSYFQPLSWGLRLKVALGAAKGLAFLHSDETKVIYKDFKTSNVLLDSHYNAKLADLGLSMEAPTRDKSRVSSRVMGTYGYAAPEYLATGHVSAKSDVFSFGVVLLELLSGRRTVDKNRPSGQHNLVEWAKPYMANKRKLLRVLDNRLEGQYDIDEAFKVATLCLRCLATESKLRPNMHEVVTDLEHLQVPHVHHNRSVNTSRGRRKSADDLTKGRSVKASLSPLSHDVANTRP